MTTGSRQATDSWAKPSSSAYQCPDHGRRVKGVYGVVRDRFATLDPAIAPQESAPIEEYGPD